MVAVHLAIRWLGKLRNFGGETRRTEGETIEFCLDIATGVPPLNFCSNSP